MAAPNENWMRWITASFYKYFNDNKGSYTLHLEGMARAVESIPNRAELRIDGPNIVQPSKGVWRLYCEINILIAATVNANDLYTYQRMMGHFSSLFIDHISIFKLGDGGGDTGDLLGCMQLKYEKNERVQINTFGVIAPEVSLQQGSVEGHYEMLITGE
jgi:hypothetical protein